MKNIYLALANVFLCSVQNFLYIFYRCLPFCYSYYYRHEGANCKWTDVLFVDATFAINGSIISTTTIRRFRTSVQSQQTILENIYYFELSSGKICVRVTDISRYISQEKSLCLFGSNVTLEGKSSQQEEDEGKANFSKRLVASDFCTLKMPCHSHGSVRFSNLMIMLPTVHISNVQLRIFSRRVVFQTTSGWQHTYFIERKCANYTLYSLTYSDSI